MRPPPIWISIALPVFFRGRQGSVTNSVVQSSALAEKVASSAAVDGMSSMATTVWKQARSASYFTKDRASRSCPSWSNARISK